MAVFIAFAGSNELDGGCRAVSEPRDRSSGLTGCAVTAARVKHEG